MKAMPKEERTKHTSSSTSFSILSNWARINESQSAVQNEPSVTNNRTLESSMSSD